MGDWWELRRMNPRAVGGVSRTQRRVTYSEASGGGGRGEGRGGGTDVENRGRVPSDEPSRAKPAKTNLCRRREGSKSVKRRGAKSRYCSWEWEVLWRIDVRVQDRLAGWGMG